MILLTGGSGILGTELRKHIDFYSPSHDELDIINFIPRLKYETDLVVKLKYETELIVHCAAFTDLVRAESERKLCYDTNVLGTRNLASLGIPMLYISTEYVFDGTKGNYDEHDYPNPQNFYALTKLLGEYESRRVQSTVVRCLFKPRPFKHALACVDQFTSGDYVDVIAKEIVLGIKNFDRLPATIHIGTGRKSTFDLARESRAVGETKVEDIREVRLPRDTSLDCSQWLKLKEELCK